MKKLISLFCILLALCLGGYAQKKPNIVLIMADDLGMEALGAYGNDDKLTPNLDKLAAEGMLFKNCFSTPLCTPSRVQLMTGKYNHRNYVGFGILDPNEKTFAHYMKEQGYKTCIAGKWQLLGNEKQKELAKGAVGSLPQQAGFDKFALWQVDKLGSRYKDPTIYTDKRESVEMKGRFAEDVFADYIEKFISDNRNDPFFVYYPMCLTHDPFQPTPFSPDYNNEGKKKIDDPRYFKDMLKYMDHQVKRITDKLDATGLREETLILFIGDNGTSPQVISRFRGKSYQGGKGQTIKRGTHVPMIANWKGVIRAGSVNSSLVDFTDFLPSMLDVAGAKTVKSAGLEGVSFYPQLKGDLTVTRPWVFTHYDPRWGKFTRKTFVHDLHWKLYDTGEIYDIKNDPDELIKLSKGNLKQADLKVIQQFEQVLKEKMNKS